MLDDALRELKEVQYHLHSLHRDIRRMVEATLTHNLPLEALSIMSALIDLQALGPRIDAVTAALPTDVATAVAAATATLTQQLSDATAAAAKAESDLQTEVDSLTTSVAALEAAAGVPAPTTVGLAVSPSTVSASFGTVSSVAISITGGTGPYSVSGLPTGASFDGTSINFDTTTLVGTTSATVSDSASPPATTLLSVSIS